LDVRGRQGESFARRGLEVKDTMRNVDLKDFVDRFISTLPSREREVLWRRYWRGEKMREVAASMGLNIAMVQRLSLGAERGLWEMMRNRQDEVRELLDA